MSDPPLILRVDKIKITKRKESQMTFTTTNFTALEIRQGYRLDNTYFGVCSNCGDHIHKSRFGNAWLHTIATGEHSSRTSEYCPEPYES
jgi:hypothetical protein